MCSPSANSVFDGKFAYVPALEDVLVWDVKKGQMVYLGFISLDIEFLTEANDC